MVLMNRVFFIPHGDLAAGLDCTQSISGECSPARSQAHREFDEALEEPLVRRANLVTDSMPGQVDAAAAE